jgi:hypothetical protein
MFLLRLISCANLHTSTRCKVDADSPVLDLFYLGTRSLLTLISCHQVHVVADSPDRSSSSLLSHAPADVAVAEPLSQTSPAPRFNSSALLPGLQPSIHSIHPITIPHLSAQREVAHVAEGGSGCGGCGEPTSYSSCF